MRSLLRNRIILTILLTVFLLTFLKIDFRFQDTVFCCGDDHDYYIHAETIAIDFDLDYSNQLEGFETRRFSLNGKIAPTGFIGSGIYASPFLFLGNILDNLLAGNKSISEEVMNYRLLFYSLSSIVYFFLTIKFTINILRILDYKFSPLVVYIIYGGSGLSYYAFERFSMTHIYECFSVVIIFYLSLKFYTSTDNKRYAIAIPLLIALGISVKWVNYFLFLIPYMAKKLLENKYKANLVTLSKNYLFIISSIFSIFTFFMHTKALYGIYTFNPQFVYRTGGAVSSFITRDGSFYDFILNNILNIFKILFSQEFGLFWFSPIIFLGFVISIYNIFTSSKKSLLFNLIAFASFSQIFVIVLLWKSTASAYGYRYLFCLIPLSIILFIKSNSENKNNYLNSYIVIFSIFSLFSVLFFETTSGTQLSLTETTNTFGRYLKYTQPMYLKGYLLSFLEINSYLKIFTTSFFGAAIFKFIFIFIEPNSLISTLDNFGLPVNNPDFIEYVNQLEQINISKFVFIIIFFLFISNSIYKEVNNK